MKPIFFYDGECAFCRRWMERWKTRVVDAVEFRSGSPLSAVRLEMPDGSSSTGAKAIFQLLAHAPSGGFGMWCYTRLPGFAIISEWIYRIVASRRPFWSAMTRGRQKK